MAQYVSTFVRASQAGKRMRCLKSVHAIPGICRREEPPGGAMVREEVDDGMKPAREGVRSELRCRERESSTAVRERRRKSVARRC